MKVPVVLIFEAATLVKIRQADDLHIAQVELGLDLGHLAELGRADRGEVLGVREQNLQESPSQS
jgi:hypothetical protein